MAILPNTSAAYSLVAKDEIKINGLPTDAGALKIIVQDYERSSQWLASKQWALRWREAQARYEPIRNIQCWENTDIPRSSLNVYTVAQIVQSILPKAMEGIFSDDPFFTLQSRPGTSAETGRAIASIIHFQLEDCGFRQEIENGAQDAILFGTNIWGVNWEEVKRQRKIYKRKADPVKLPLSSPGAKQEYLHTGASDTLIPTTKDASISRPIVETLDLTTVFVDPGLRSPNIRKAKFVIRRKPISAQELDDLRNTEGYTIPSNAELMQILFSEQEQAPATALESSQTAGSNANHQAKPTWEPSTVDVTADNSKFWILERWDDNKVMTALNDKLVIRNEENPVGSIPFFSVGWWRVPNSFYSMGVGITAGDEQEVQKGIINALIDEISFNLNLPYLSSDGKNTLTQSIRMYLGKIVKVDDVGSMKPMERIQAVPEAAQQIQASEARAEASSGANEQMVQGATPSQGRTSLGRTATGANLLAGGSGSRIESFVDRLADQVLIPVMNMFFELDKEFLPLEQIREILSDELAEAWIGDEVDVLNARVKFDILPASRTVARQRMAQALPMLAQTLLTDPMHGMLTQQSQKIDVNELVNMFFDISGYKNKADLVVPMTDEDTARANANNPGQQQTQVAVAKANAETQGQLQKVDADNSGKLVREMVRHSAQADESAADRKHEHETEIITPDNNTRAYKEIERQALEKQLTQQYISGEPNANGFGA